MIERDFVIDRLQDNSFRITRIDVPDDKHTHLHSRKLANVIINNVINEKLPLNSHTRTLVSMYRLADDGKYRDKIEMLINTRKQKTQQKCVKSCFKKI